MTNNNNLSIAAVHYPNQRPRTKTPTPCSMITTTPNPTTRTRSLSTLSLKYSSDSEPDFATIYASQRFFVTSPGRSNSIIESTPSIYNKSISDQSMISSTSSSGNSPYVAVSTYSPDPYMDFRQSMQEMVDARDMHAIVDDAKANGDYLHELLLCCLALNPKSTYKFIIGAFTELLRSIVPPRRWLTVVVDGEVVVVGQ